MTRQNQAYLYAGSAVLMWSTVGSAFKLTLRYLSPVPLLLFSSFISVIELFMIILVQNKIRFVLSSSLREITFSALNAILNPFLFYIVLFTSYDRLLTQEAMVINFTWPVTLTILSILFLKQRIRWMSLAAIFISFFGVAVIATKGNFQTLQFADPVGVALALSSTVIWSFFWIINIRDKRDEVIKLFLNFFFGFLYILLLTLSLNMLTIPKWEATIGVTYIGIFEMGVAYVFWLKGLRLSSNTAKVSNLIFLAPFISLVIIHLTVGEPLLWSTLAGLAFITVGIVIQRMVKG